MRTALPETVSPAAAEDRDATEFRRAWEEPGGEFLPQRALAVAASLDGLWEYDLAQGDLHCSRRCLELLDYGTDEFPRAADFLATALHPEDAPFARDAVSRGLEDGTPADIECRLRTRSGEYRWFRARGRAQRDAEGRTIRVSGVLQDITERKRAESAILERLQFEKLLADLSAKFVNALPGQLDELFEQSLQTLVESLGNDRSTLVRFTEDKKRVLVTHSHAVDRCEMFPLGPFAVARLPWFIGQFRRCEPVFMRCLPEDLPPEAEKEKQYCIAHGIKSNVAIPLSAGGRVLGALTFAFVDRHCEWPADIIARLRLIGEVFANALLHSQNDEALHQALAENKALRARLEQENLYLREQIVLRHHHGGIVGQSDVLKKALAMAERVATTDTPVLLLGETGTGKELLAQTIHKISTRKDRAMVIVNCASLPATLIESELFGREAGAYTGAASAQVGRFVVADGSTLFLDEIGEFPIELQAKLLRVLQDGRFERLGSPETVRADVRIIAATNRDLEQAVRDGKFRPDLYHRLNVFPIHVPPLRERQEDIPQLVWTFVERFGRHTGRTIKDIPRRIMEQLQRYSWPGNVRELSNIIERAMILTRGDTLQVELPSVTRSDTAPPMTLKEGERAHILRVLHETGWRIRGAQGAAEILGLKPTTLESRMARLGIKRGKRNSDMS